MEDDDRFFDIDGLAAYSGLSAATLRRFMGDADNPLPNHHVARAGHGRGRVLVSKREFDAWVKRFPPVGGDAAAAEPDTAWIRRTLAK
jgi:hypothetical protein